MEDINKCHTLFFDSINLDSELVIKVVEGKRAAKPESVIAGGTNFGAGYKLEPSSISKKFKITFTRPVAWQAIDESFTSDDESEEIESEGLFCILTKSQYIDYIDSSHGFYKDIIGVGKHYRIWTEDQVIDVISVEPPELTAQ